MDLDPELVLKRTADRVGRPPRKFSLLRWRYGKGSKPDWLTPKDQITQIYIHERDILTRGEVRWAAVIHANNTLFVPGSGMSGAQVVYSQRGTVPLQDLREVASRCFDLKGTLPENPGERRLAEMLTDELERALDWPIPATIADGRDLITTIVMIPRELVPGRILACPFFPILADPATRYAVLVPSHYWEARFRRLWHQEAEDIARQWNEQGGRNDGVSAIPVQLSEAAAERVRNILREQSLDVARVWLRVGVAIRGSREGDKSLKFEASRPGKHDMAFKSQGIQIVINNKEAPYLEGTLLDFRDGESGTGFTFGLQ